MRLWGLSERRRSPLKDVDRVLASSEKPLDKSPKCCNDPLRPHRISLGFAVPNEGEVGVIMRAFWERVRGPVTRHTDANHYLPGGKCRQ